MAFRGRVCLPTEVSAKLGLLFLAMAPACTDRSPERDGTGEATGTEESGSTVGEEPDDCAEPSVEGEILACGAGATRLAVGWSRVFWVAGTTTQCSPVPCPEPSIYSVPKEGGPRIKLAALPESAELISADARIAFGTDDAVYELMTDDVHVLDAQGAHHILASGDSIFWSGRLDGVLWHATADGGRDVVANDGVTFFDHSDGVFAWATSNDTTIHSTRAKGPIALADSTVLAVVIASGAVAWATTAGGLFAAPLEGGGETRLATQNGVYTAVTDGGGYVYYSVFAPSGFAEVRRVPIAGGPVESVLISEQLRVTDVAVDNGFIYWIDGRVLRRPIH